ncbi:hypothetical protein IF1G_02124 [Cordyceps javanica]|uniref:Uncharacterized protein n=1 Tax=Cordyceps javanica TaxID=43265 RepID=A0A545VE46_9HYPO|nr:hypothetical protein IF1G_02124 [Cordyceps javanica]
MPYLASDGAGCGYKFRGVNNKGHQFIASSWLLTNKVNRPLSLGLGRLLHLLKLAQRINLLDYGSPFEESIPKHRGFDSLLVLSYYKSLQSMPYPRDSSSWYVGHVLVGADRHRKG